MRFPLILFAALILSACAAVPGGGESVIELPGELITYLQLGVGIVVTFVLTELAKRGFDFQGHKAQITASLAAAAVVILNAILAKVPVTYEGFAVMALQVLVLILGSFGLYKGFRTLYPKPQG